MIYLQFILHCLHQVFETVVHCGAVLTVNYRQHKLLGRRCDPLACPFIRPPVLWTCAG